MLPSGPQHADPPRLFSCNRYNDGPRSPFYITLKMKDLLPGAQQKLSVFYGNSKRRSHQRRLKVGMAIPVVPCLLVSVVARGWNDSIQELRNVSFQPGFILHGTDDASAAYVKYVSQTGFYA